MTIAQEISQQLTQALALSAISPVIQLELEKQANILVLSTLAYGPISAETRVSLMPDSIEIIMDFAQGKRLMITTGYPDARYYAAGPPTDTLVNTYINRKPYDFDAVNHQAAPDLIKRFLNRLKPLVPAT